MKSKSPKLSKIEKRVKYTIKSVKSERQYRKVNKYSNKKASNLLKIKSINSNSADESGVESIRMINEGFHSLTSLRSMASRVNKSGNLVVNVFKIPRRIKISQSRKELKTFLAMNRNTRSITEKHLKYKGLKYFSNANIKVTQNLLQKTAQNNFYNLTKVNKPKQTNINSKISVRIKKIPRKIKSNYKLSSVKSKPANKHIIKRFMLYSTKRLKSIGSFINNKTDNLIRNAQVDTSDVNDTGIESLRLSAQSIKGLKIANRGTAEVIKSPVTIVKQVKRTINSTKHNIRKIKRFAHNARKFNIANSQLNVLKYSSKAAKVLIRSITKAFGSAIVSFSPYIIGGAAIIIIAVVTIQSAGALLTIILGSTEETVGFVMNKDNDTDGVIENIKSNERAITDSLNTIKNNIRDKLNNAKEKDIVVFNNNEIYPYTENKVNINNQIDSFNIDELQVLSIIKVFLNQEDSLTDDQINDFIIHHYVIASVTVIKNVPCPEQTQEPKTNSTNKTTKPPCTVKHNKYTITLKIRPDIFNYLGFSSANINDVDNTKTILSELIKTNG